MEAFENIGEFTCIDGQLIICDSFPLPQLFNNNMSQDNSQCLHVNVKPGKYRVIYLYFDEDARDYNPARVEIIHESLKAMPTNLIKSFAKIQVEGGRITVMDRHKVSNEHICSDFQFDVTDTIHHDCGFVLTTLGDGEFKIGIEESEELPAALNIILEDQVEDDFEEEVD